jgi:outer membrane protein
MNTGAPGARSLGRKLSLGASPLLVALTLIALPSRAMALQSLQEFLAAAEEVAFDNREQRAIVEEADARTEVTRSALLPSISATGSYTRNEHEVLVTLPTGATGGTRQVTFTPYDQLEAVFTLEVPLVDASGIVRLAAARESEDATRLAAEAASRQVAARVVAAYYQYVAATALVDSARVALEAARDSQAYVQQRANSGLESDLDVERATAELERARQTVAEAEQTLSSSARSLHSLSGVEPSAGAPPLPEDLDVEAPLASWIETVESRPEVIAADLSVRAAKRSVTADWMAFVPTLSARASERLTNAEGFGEPTAWSASLALSFRAGVGPVMSARASEAALEAALVRADRARQEGRDQIEELWEQIGTLRVQCEAARAQAVAARRAASIAHDRLHAGSVTLLDVVQADRDALGAEVSRLQAFAELANARAQLRIVSGRFGEGRD